MIQVKKILESKCVSCGVPADRLVYFGAGNDDPGTTITVCSDCLRNVAKKILGSCKSCRHWIKRRCTNEHGLTRAVGSGDYCSEWEERKCT